MPAPVRTIPIGAALLAVVLVVAAGGSPSRGAGAERTIGAQRTVDVYPIDGTSTAGPGTQISFRGATKIKDLRVDGSSTGRHSGRLAKHSDGAGVSFIPDRGFRTGELVTVQSSTKLTGATSAGAIRFRILTPANVSGAPAGDPEGDPAGVQRFHTRSDLRPPGLEVTTREAAASDDAIFLAVKGGPGQDGPTIRDAKGRLIWFRRVPPPLSPYDFRAQTYRGRPVLTWWEGKVVTGKGSGQGVILDSSYRVIKHVKAGNGFHMDQHEFEITPRGTAFINVYEPVVYSLRPIGGPRRAAVWDSIVQEIDIKTGLVLFEWHSLAHVSVRLGTFPVRSGFPYDPFHVNSVSEDANGNLLLSARNTNALFLVDRDNGRLLTRIGGKKSDWEMGPGTTTIGQHEAALQGDGTISVFDNGGSTRFPTMPDRESRGVTLRLHQDAGRVSLEHEYKHPGTHLFSRSQGSMQVLPNGDVFLSWGGSNPYLTELTSDGKTVFESHILPPDDDTYRAYRLPWQGARPTGRPDVAASSGSSSTKVYASWNGATDVARWEVLAGAGPSVLAPVAMSTWENFETTISLPGLTPKYVAVRALDKDGGVLGTSATIRPK